MYMYVHIFIFESAWVHIVFFASFICTGARRNPAACGAIQSDWKLWFGTTLIYKRPTRSIRDLFEFSVISYTPAILYYYLYIVIFCGNGAEPQPRTPKLWMPYPRRGMRLGYVNGYGTRGMRFKPCLGIRLGCETHTPLGYDIQRSGVRGWIPHQLHKNWQCGSLHISWPTYTKS